MKCLKYILAIVILLFVAMAFDLVRNKDIRLYEEYEIFSERELLGKAWLVITSQEQAAAVENKHGIVLPSIDFSKYYLLESQGRKIKKLKYRNISRFFWEYDVPTGIEEFMGETNSHVIYVYKIDKHQIKQKED